MQRTFWGIGLLKGIPKFAPNQAATVTQASRTKSGIEMTVICQSKAQLMCAFLLAGWLAIPISSQAQTSSAAPTPVQEAPKVPEQEASAAPVVGNETEGQGTDKPPTVQTDRKENQQPQRPKNKRVQNKRRKKLEFTKQGGVVYQTIDDEQLKCDVYTPKGEGPFPAILAVHGGAWRQGSKFALIRHAWKMAQAGYVVVAINYRHAPKHPFPAQIHDCKHAIRWMKFRASEMKIDANHIGAFGYSAGGHLVSLLGTSDPDDKLEGDVPPEMKRIDTRIKAIAAGGAPCEFSWIDDDSRVLSYWLGGSPDQKPEAYRAASPTTYVSPDDPPFFLFHGDSDLIVPASSPLKLHESLEKSGVSSKYFTAKGSGHLATFSDIDWMEKAILFFDKHLKEKDAAQPTTENPDKPATDANP